jgi:hypothetical protein
MPGNDDDKKTLVGTVTSIFSWNLPIVGTVRRGIDTLGNVAADVSEGKFGKAATDYIAGTGENIIATIPGAAPAGALWRTGYREVIGHTLGEKYKPEQSGLVKDAKTIVHKVTRPKP